MKLARIAVDRPMTMYMFYVAVILLGAVSLGELSVDLLPDISYPRLSVITNYPGVAPEDIETLITAPLESAVSRVPGLRRVESVSKEGVSLLTLEEWRAYAALAIRGQHIVIRKQQGRPKGRDHINGIEGFWSYAKNWMYPLRGVPRRYSHLYLGEVAFRFNHRHEDLLPLLERLMKRTQADELTSTLVRIR